ncbi:MAG TPA: zf-HC2 domain-containing protein [Thermoanaerobaculia bacterium]|nr:zf-HC2 domain-containing protein [Thermoanaerobaculia bacterium]
MNRHLSIEQLSAFLDSELGVVEMRQLEAHCAGCPDCGARLASMRRVVAGLGRADRAVPPPALSQQIRRQVMKEIPAHGMRRTFQSLRFFLFPLGPGLRTASAMGLALVVSLFAVSHGFVGNGFPHHEPGPGLEVVTVKAGAPYGMLLTTSEVAGRQFIWTEAGWVQRGLEWETPVASVDAGSPQGRELLTRYSDLKFLLADGSPVVLRYNLETVEIRNPAPNRILGFEAQPHPSQRHHGRLLAA